MKDDILFFENQPFWRNWIALIAIISVNLLFIGGFIGQVFFGIPWGNNPMSNSGLIITTGFTLLLAALLFVRQQTVITHEGIYVRYFPLDFKTRFFAWDDIREAYVRKYSPTKEFGGWGFRYHFNTKKGIAYNVSGSIGLQLVLKKGKKVLIGTNKWIELEEVLLKNGLIGKSTN